MQGRDVWIGDPITIVGELIVPIGQHHIVVECMVGGCEMCGGTELELARCRLWRSKI